MQHCWDICQSKDPEKIVWGGVGPRLIRNAVNEVFPQYQKDVVKPAVFCPVGFASWVTFVNPNFNINFGNETYCVHMWNEMWRRNNIDKSGVFHADCYYEKLKKRYLNV